MTTFADRGELLSVIRIMAPPVKRSTFKNLHLLGRGDRIFVLAPFELIQAEVLAENADFSVIVDASYLQSALESIRSKRVALVVEGEFLKIIDTATLAVVSVHAPFELAPEPLEPETSGYIRIPAGIFDAAFDAVGFLTDPKSLVKFVHDLIIDYKYPETSTWIAGGNVCAFGRCKVPVITNLNGDRMIRITLQTAKMVIKVISKFKVDSVDVYEPFKENNSDYWTVHIRVGPFTFRDLVEDTEPLPYERYFDLGGCSYSFDLDCKALETALSRIATVAKSANKYIDHAFSSVTLRKSTMECTIEYSYRDVKVFESLPILACALDGQDIVANVDAFRLLGFVKAMSRLEVKAVRLAGGYGWDRQLMIVQPANNDGLDGQAYVFVPEVRPYSEGEPQPAAESESSESLEEEDSYAGQDCHLEFSVHGATSASCDN